MTIRLEWDVQTSGGTTMVSLTFADRQSMQLPDDMHAKALSLLPHGPEFRFVDRLLELEPGKRGVGEYCVRGDESFLRGHFPGNPIMPGVLLIEAAAQLAGVVAQSDPTVRALPELKLAALRNVKISGSARPGEVIRIETRVAGRLGNLIQAHTLVYVGEKLVLSSELVLSGASDSASG